jgi:hypothetical protein
MFFLPVGWEYEHDIAWTLLVVAVVPLVGDTWLLRTLLKRLRRSSLATGPQRREISPVEMRLVELRVMDSLKPHRRAFTETHGLNR